MNIGTVVEGPTDRMVLETVVQQLWPGEHRFISLQPKSSDTFDETGTGWKGVRRWCKSQVSVQRLEQYIDRYGPCLDVLLIQVDVDIVAENDLQEALEEPVPDMIQPCPPIMATVNQLQQVVARWFGCMEPGSLPPQVILVFPSQDMENWTFAALHPDDPLCQSQDYECLHRKGSREHPAYCLTLRKYGRHLERSGHEIKKRKRRYEPLLPIIAAQWPTVRQTCSQAEAFSFALEHHWAHRLEGKDCD